MEVRIKATPLFKRTQSCKAQTVVHVGGAGSSKSFTLAQLMITKMMSEEDKTIVVSRKTMPSLKRSSYGLIIDLLTESGLYVPSNHNKTDHVYRDSGCAMHFMALDEPTKVKSFKDGVNYIWLEEADEFTYDDYMMFKLQLRKPTTTVNQIFLSLNPIDEHGWIPQRLLREEDVELIHSTHEDNPFLNPDYRKVILNFINEDENYYRVYTLGEWGILENLIFSNYELIDELPQKFDAWCYGLDFGYVHPTALIKVLLYERTLYWHEVLCESGLTNSDLIERLGHLERADIYADSAEPQRIEEIFRAGYNIYPANKDVKMGIDTCQRQTIHITKESVNLLKQIRGYQRKKDKNGNTLEEPVKIRDDTVDAGRYGTLGITERFGFATATPGGNAIRTQEPSFSFG